MKYKLTDNTKNQFGTTLYQIKSLKDFSDVKAGDLGGWVASEKNLSQEGDCWVYGNAEVSDNAKVYDDAKVCGNAKVYGNARVYGDAWVCDNAKVYGNARVYDDAWVFGDAKVYGDACVKRGSYVNTPTSITRSDGYTFTTQSDGSIVAGCRDFTPEQADEHWGNTNHHMHKESWAIVQALRSIQASKG